MGVYVKGMKMPESGYVDVRLHKFADGKTLATIQTEDTPYYKEFELIEVKEPHGRLVDGHKLILSLNDWWYSSFGLEENEKSKAIKEVIEAVEAYVNKVAESEE